MARKYGRPTTVPAIPDQRTAKADDMLRAVKEILEVREGRRGDRLDRMVTFRDLLDAGALTPGQVGEVIGGPPPIPLVPGSTDPATPPTPTNLSAVGALMSITLTWEFAPGYSRLAYFEVWRSETDALGDAEVIAQTFGPIYSDVVGPEGTYYYWVRAVSDAGQSPFNAVAGTLGETPFFLQPEDTEVNGEPVQAGAYLASAWIMNGVVTNAKIGNLAVDDAKIVNLSVAKLLAGSLAVGQYIQSSNYASGDTGFHINANGNAEFNAVTVRGSVYATAGVIGGNEIDSSGIESPNYNGTSAGWRINSDGSAVFNSGTFRGALGAATGTFAGELSAATGTFAGNVIGGQFMTGDYTGYAWPPAGGTGSYIGPAGLLLGNYNDGKYFNVTAQGDIYAPGFQVVNGVMTVTQANVIETLNIAGNAVTVPGSAYTAAEVTVSASDNLDWVAVQSLTMTLSGGQVFYAFSADVSPGSYLKSDSSAEVFWFEECPVQVSMTGVTGVAGTTRRGGVFSFSETPPPGTYTFTVYARNLIAASLSSPTRITNRSLFIIETKR